ncbi:MAG: adenylate/guanylate cyclase domain-containing protein [Gemmatimonadaceae bacterium]|nr:adenylate/guanylate cyclase domain-containing protein [Gemmatimonadaceae bacterium]
MPRLTDRPALRERLADSPRLPVAGGVLCAGLALLLAMLLRTGASLDRGAWDRIATALADTPVSSRVLVVRAASRTGDWKVADAVERLDAAGAAAVQVAIDLSTPVAPAGSMPDLLRAAPHATVGVTLAVDASGADTVAWPWFLAPGAARSAERARRIGRTALVRDADGVVRTLARRRTDEHWLAEGAALALLGPGGATAPDAGADGELLRFARTDTLWFGVRAVSLDSVMVLAPDGLRRLVQGGVVLLGIDDGSTVPTSVGMLPPLAILAHESAARALVRSGQTAPIRPATPVARVAWALVWIVAGALLAAHWSLRRTVLAGAAGVVLMTGLTLWMADARGTWLPLGTTLLAWVMALAGADIVALWQARRQQRLTTLLFSRFVTPALAGEAWKARHLYLQGGRPAPLALPVTVLFLDLRGFTRFSEGHDAAAVMALLTDVTAACAADIATFGGLVDDFAGDGIKADFGVPVPRRSAGEVARDAQDAVACAQQLAHTIARLLPDAPGRPGTRARIGVHSGAAVAGTVGGGTRLKYTVVGDVVNVASRLQSVDLSDDGTTDAPCRIVVSADTMVLLGTAAPPAIDLGPLALPGRTAPVCAFRLRSTASARS